MLISYLPYFLPTPKSIQQPSYTTSGPATRSVELENLERAALRDLRARWFDNVDHDIKQQLKGQVASTFAYFIPELGCPPRTRTSCTSLSVETATAQPWSDTVRALSAPVCKNPRSTQMRASEGRTRARSVTTVMPYSSRTGSTRFIPSGTSGGM